MVKSKGSKTKERNKGNHSLTTSLYIGVIVAEWLAIRYSRVQILVLWSMVLPYINHIGTCRLNRVWFWFFCTSSGKRQFKKTSQIDTNSISFSCQRKQVSRRCINFPHELTRQILTTQSINVGRRA